MSGPCKIVIIIDMKFNSQSNFDFHMKNSGNPKTCNSCEFKSCTKLGLSRHKINCNERRKLQINPVTANALSDTLGGPSTTTKKTNVLNV